MNNLLKNIDEVPRDKKLIVFDLDGTLVETKSLLDAEMADLLGRLLGSKSVAVISGAKYELFQDQIIHRLKCPESLSANLFLFPTTGTSFYRYNNGWNMIYSEELTEREKSDIRDAVEKAFLEVNYEEPKKVYGITLEDRKTQVTYSFLGQDVVKVLGEEGVRLKKVWRDEHTNLKLEIAEVLQRLLPGLEVRAAGYTSIDITRKGIDKEYGLKQMEKYLGIPIEDMLFIGDAIFPGGNDYAALKTGVLSIKVEGVGDTKKIIRRILGI